MMCMRCEHVLLFSVGSVLPGSFWFEVPILILHGQLDKASAASNPEISRVMAHIVAFHPTWSTWLQVIKPYHGRTLLKQAGVFDASAVSIFFGFMKDCQEVWGFILCSIFLLGCIHAQFLFLEESCMFFFGLGGPAWRSYDRTFVVLAVTCARSIDESLCVWPWGSRLGASLHWGRQFRCGNGDVSLSVRVALQAPVSLSIVVLGICVKSFVATPLAWMATRFERHCN